MKKIFSAILASTILIACGKKDEEAPVPVAVQKPVEKKIQAFQFSKDSTIDSASLVIYSNAYRGLNELDQKIVETLKITPPADHAKILEGLSSAKDALCAKVGMTNYKTYLVVDSLVKAQKASASALKSLGLFVP